MDIYNLTIKEKEQAKQNGFVLLGKTGAGKSTLFNALFGKDIAEVKKKASSVTTKSSVYYYKLENGKCVSIIDTPGLSDTSKLKNENIDDEHLKGITEIIRKENIHLKGILFLSNFQNERFDADEQRALLNYNTIFPLKKFWTYTIIVFTHYFTDPEGDSLEDMKKEREESNGEIFREIMEKVKEVSDVIAYENLNIKYFNSYSPVKNEKQKYKNKLVKNELEIEINKLCLKEPLFTKVELLKIDNYKIVENGKTYLCQAEVTGTFDLNLLPLKQNRTILSKREIKPNEIIPKTKIEGKVYSGKRDENDNIIHKEEVATEENSNIMKLLKKGGEMSLFAMIGGGIGAAVAGAVGVVSAPAIGVGAAIGGGISLIKSLFS